MRVEEVPDAPEYQNAAALSFRQTPAIAPLLKRLGLTVRIVDVPRNLELIAAHICALDERLAALESKKRR